MQSNPRHIDNPESYSGPEIPPVEILHSASEKELVAACKAGNRKAQKRVYELFAGRMLIICRRYAKDSEQAKDLLHDGFIKVFLNLSKFQEKSALSTWITRIMINNCISAIRKDLRRGMQVDMEKAESYNSVGPAEYEIRDAESLTAQDVFAELTHLPLGYRTVFSMYLLDGYSHKEIAASLGISVGTSKSQLAKARKMLAQRLNNRKS